MNIGIYELEHFESVYPLIRLLDRSDNRLFLFTSVRVYNELQQKLKTTKATIEWIIKPEHQSIRKFLFKIESVCIKHSFHQLFLHTVSNNHLFFARLILRIKSVTQAVITVHDVNNLFHSQFSLHPRRLIRHLGKKLLIQQCNHYLTISESVSSYLHSIVRNHTTVQWFPGGLFEPEQYIAPKSIHTGFKIVVPGSVDAKRRNYAEVFQMIEMFRKENLRIELRLLGGFGSLDKNELMEQCRAVQHSYHDFFFYESTFVDGSEFEAQLQQAHFIWVPSVIHTMIADHIEEIYGISKSSGSLFDAIRYARPVLAPSELKIDKHQSGSVYSYGNINELLQFLQSIAGDPAIYDKWSDRALETSRFYQIERLQVSLPIVF